jgi:lactate dehydrogenase-like 2-hydroxyacid dehydrogenase
MPRLTRLAILDDYQGVTLRLGPWERLSHLDITVFRDTLAEREALVERLAPFDAILAMRERTPFPRGLIERLPNLKLLITTGERNRGIDAAACAERGVVFCGTPSFGAPTVDLTWGLILGLARRIPEEQASLRAGAWQQGLGMGLEGRTLGLLGLGKLGSRVAKVGQAFGMKVIAWSQNLTAEAGGGGGGARGEAGAVRARRRALHPPDPLRTLARAGGRGGARGDEAHGLPGEHLARPHRGPGGADRGARGGAARWGGDRCV